ncbi:DUF4252 domain-containing protein [Parabacteroides sp. PF5-9]|uniref:DUF4252 domain-containing protein n=1 Tax=Parabacteroides sp. PF5-9 TaxID=1742404 RepID=UPI00247482A9|nr:DUF4252 domain-containing protein [Parabacteroides sp. PF5-9]MDH6356316.1 hypothetical protein [Parabacteroides sp. PF5-9]
MKNYIIVILLLVMFQTGYSQKSVDHLYKEFRKEQSATSLSVGKFTLGLASLFTETMGVDKIELFALDECDTQVKERFAAAIRQLKDPGYETMVNSNDDKNRSKILVKIEDEMIKEMIVLTTGNSNAMVRIKGNIKPSDIERVVNKHGNER